MNGTQTLIAVAYGIVCVVATLIAIGLWMSTRTRLPADPQRLAERERFWLVVVIAVLGALLFSTIFFTPYGQSTPANAQVVDVTARQFAWSFDPASAKAGRPVEFVLRSTDVNHGFGLYDGSKLLEQTQVLPGRTATLVHTFHRAGTYDVLCLEFCGDGHHLMRGRFQVTK